MAIESLSINQKAFENWLKVSEPKPSRFVAFVDGDPVESGNDFRIVATNASQLARLRGEGAELDIYDAETYTSTPR